MNFHREIRALLLVTAIPSIIFCLLVIAQVSVEVFIGTTTLVNIAVVVMFVCWTAKLSEYETENYAHGNFDESCKALAYEMEVMPRHIL